MAIPFAAFGPGILIVSRTDTTYPVPINVGYAQELTLDFAGTTKPLYGQNQYPLVAARSIMKPTGKWKAAVVSGIAWNNAFYGSSTAQFAAGGIAWVIGSTITVASGTTAVQVGSSLTFDADLGLNYGSTNSNTPLYPLQRVTTGNEAVGRYSIGSTTPGLYNFVAAETTGTLSFKVTYTQSTTTGQSNIVTNQLIGTTPTFQLDYYTSLNQPTAKPFAVRLYQCVAAKHMMAFKLEDFMMPEFDFDIFANAAGQVVNYIFPEVS